MQKVLDSDWMLAMDSDYYGVGYGSDDGYDNDEGFIIVRYSTLKYYVQRD
jgi:hypothetical protein